MVAMDVLDGGPHPAREGKVFLLVFLSHWFEWRFRVYFCNRKVFDF